MNRRSQRGNALRQPLQRSLVLALCVAAISCAVGCGATTIRTNDRNAAIYVNGKEVGKGQARIARRGGPAAIEIRVQSKDGTEVTQVVKREFSPALGFLILWGWAFPPEVKVELPNVIKSGWSKGGDPWERPPEGWQPSAGAEKPATGEWGDPNAAEPATQPSSASQPQPAPAPQPAPPSAAPGAQPARAPVKKPTAPPTQSNSDSVWERPPPAQPKP